MSAPPDSGPAFDPFLAAPLIAPTSQWPSRRLLVLVPVVAAAGLAVAIAEGSLGSPSDFQLWADFKRVAGIGSIPASEPRFPLIRDYPSWFLATVIALTCALVHRQWCAMRDCLPQLRKAEVLRPREPSSRDARAYKLLGLQRILRDDTSGDGLGALVEKVNNNVLRRLGLANVLVAFVAVLLVSLLVLGQNRTGIFEAVAPGGQSEPERAAWLATTYESWWASTYHVAGVLVYSAIATLGLFVILLQNVIGFVCVYLCVAIPVLDKPDVNWSNPDGRYGWKPLANAYETVTWSVVLHGLALSLLLFVLGVENFRWMLILLALWVAILPLYMIVPPLAFRRVAVDARRTRHEWLDQLEDLARREQDPLRRLQTQDFVAQHRRIADDAVIRPLRMRRLQRGPFVLGVVLPLVIATLQILIALEIG